MSSAAEQEAKKHAAITAKSKRCLKPVKLKRDKTGYPEVRIA